MNFRTPMFAAPLLCLAGCFTIKVPEPPTPPPDASEWVPLATGLQVLARELQSATPVVLSDIETPQGKDQLKKAIFARQCAMKSEDPPLLVVTGSVSLQLQGSFQDQRQQGGNVGFPTAAQLSFQVQVAKARQQQLTVPITFVAALALPNFFLGQNLPNVSALPDKPAEKGKLDNPLADQKAELQQRVLRKAHALSDAVQEQVKAYHEHPQENCPDPNQNVSFVLPELPISIVLPLSVQ